MARMNSNQAKEVFARNLRRLMDERGMDGATLARLIGVEKQSVYSWLRMRSYPTANTIQKIIDTLRVSMDELLTSGVPQVDDLTSDERELIANIRSVGGTRCAYYVLDLDTGDMTQVGGRDVS